MNGSVLDANIESKKSPGDIHFQPFEANAELEEKAGEYIGHYPDEQKRSAILPLLHLVQHKHGYISAKAIEWVATKLDIEPMRVVEVVTFYPGLRQSAPGKFHIRVCRTLSCAMGGSEELMEKLCELAGIDRSNCDGHHNPIAVSPDGNFSVEFAECLASCGTAPVCMVNDDFHEGVSPKKAQELLDEYQK